MSESSAAIAVVIPCYKVRKSIAGVIAEIGPEVDAIYVVDDACPESSGRFVEEHVSDPRVRVLHNPSNLGVGGATLAGYAAARARGAKVAVKVDGDGQMDPSLVPALVQPILDGRADYVKGNRFFRLESLEGMPAVRLLGNTALSFVNKATSGYWHIMDPTNGFTAIHTAILAYLPLEKIDRGYFFESDLLFRLYTIRAVVLELPMDAKYAGEVSSLRIRRSLFEFSYKHLRNFFKRIFYQYFLRDFNAASAQLVFGTLLLGFGVIYGAIKWYEGIVAQAANPPGVVMASIGPILIGTQLLLSVLNFDLNNAPREPIHPWLELG